MMETKAIVFLVLLGVGGVFALGSAVWTALLYKAYTADTLQVRNLIVKGRVTRNAESALDFYTILAVGDELFAQRSDQPVEINKITADNANATSLNFDTITGVELLTAGSIYVQENFVQRGNIPMLSTEIPVTLGNLNATLASFDMVQQETTNITAESLTSGRVMSQSAQFTQLKGQYANLSVVNVDGATTAHADCNSSGTATLPLLKVSNGDITFTEPASIRIKEQINANTDLNFTFAGTSYFASLIAAKDSIFYNNSQIAKLTVADELTLNNTNFVNIEINDLSVDFLKAHSITQDVNSPLKLTNLTGNEVTVGALSNTAASFSFPAAGTGVIKSMNISDQVVLANNTLSIRQNTTISANSLTPLVTESLETPGGTVKFNHLEATNITASAPTVDVATTKANVTTCSDISTTTANLTGLGTLSVTGVVTATSFGNDGKNFITLKNDQPWAETNQGSADLIAFCSSASSSQGECVWT